MNTRHIVIVALILGWSAGQAKAQSRGPRTAPRLTYRTAARNPDEALERAAGSKVLVASALAEQGRTAAADTIYWEVATAYPSTQAAAQACYALATNPKSAATRSVKNYEHAPLDGTPAITYSPSGRGVIAVEDPEYLARIEKVDPAAILAEPGAVILDAGVYGLIGEAIPPGDRLQELQWVQLTIPSDTSQGESVWTCIGSLIFPAKNPTPPSLAHSESYQGSLAKTAARRKARAAEKADRRLAASAAQYRIAKEWAGSGGFAGGGFGGFGGGGGGTSSSLCGAPTKTTGGPCQNRVAGGGYCHLHR